ncbi:hypothetical protein HH216_21650 [Spirosoma rhododendri]|uniref:Uncharacterized protein n=1 Tax=Spirosoma rhododendri TaxID=2728024 RepID=A0A7L5DSP7_9BACT|nr:hypothetical protein HH216_21650 [Spirosoma rhododendri]
MANLDSVLAVSPALTQQFSRHDLLIANAVAIIPLLRQLTTQVTTQEADRLRQQIQTRLLLAQTQVSSVAAELDCEGERADQLATYLDQADTKRVRRLTIGSVVVGAITTVATALIAGDNANKAVAISGGLVSAGLGGVAAFSSDRRIPFQHARNLLTDIWLAKDQSTAYPPVVWYVLHEKAFSNSSQHVIAYNVRQRWLDYVLPGTSASDQALYFGTGGAYRADDLHTRANMLNQLQSSVRSINQDLQSLLLNLSKR